MQDNRIQEIRAHADEFRRGYAEYDWADDIEWLLVQLAEARRRERAAHPEVRIKSCPDKWFQTGHIWWETQQVQVLEARNVINTVDFGFVLEWRGTQEAGKGEAE